MQLIIASAILSFHFVLTVTCRYTDDIPHIESELYAGLVMSTRSHATITVDYSEVVKMKGVTTYVGARDVPGSNFIGVVLDLLQVVFWLLHFVFPFLDCRSWL